MAVKQRSALSVSKEFVDFLLEEFEAACRHTLQLLEKLKKTDRQSPAHETLEGDFYGALVDLRDHAGDLVKVWDKLVGSLRKLSKDELEDYVLTYHPKLKRMLQEAWEDYQRHGGVDLDTLIERSRREFAKVQGSAYSSRRGRSRRA